MAFQKQHLGGETVIYRGSDKSGYVIHRRLFDAPPYNGNIPDAIDMLELENLLDDRSSVASA